MDDTIFYEMDENTAFTVQKIPVAKIINDIRTWQNGDSIFIKKVLDIFLSLDFNNLDIKDFRIAECKKQLIELNKAFGFDIKHFSILFLKWFIENHETIEIDATYEQVYTNFLES
jgi:hypothetical protein